MKVFAYKILFLVTHAVLTTIYFLFDFWIFCKTSVSSLFCRTHYRPPYHRESPLQKLPKHLGIVINEDFIALSDVANIILWCITVGIPHLSVYDYNGQLKRCEQQLCSELTRPERGEGGGEVYRVRGGDKLQPHVFTVQSTRDGAPSTRVCLLSAGDGRQHLLQTTRTLSQLVSSQRLKSAQIQPEYVDQVLQEKLCCPDPDAVLQFGPVQSLLGYLPWQTRLTEIIHVRTLRALDYSSLVTSLQRYSVTKQRFGK